jgi:hypothetical protein
VVLSGVRGVVCGVEGCKGALVVLRMSGVHLCC